MSTVISRSMMPYTWSISVATILLVLLLAFTSITSTYTDNNHSYTKKVPFEDNVDENGYNDSNAILETRYNKKFNLDQFIICISNCQNTNESNEGQFVHYNNKILGIEMSLPRSWIDNHEENNTIANRFSIDPNFVQFFSPQNGVELFVTVYPVPSSNISLDAYDRQYNNYNNDPTIHNLVLINTTLSEMPAHKAIFTLNYIGKSFQVMHVWTIKNNHVYKLSFSAYKKGSFEKYLPLIQIILNSFNVTKK
jgi:hypothetical protein